MEAIAFCIVKKNSQNELALASKPSDEILRRGTTLHSPWDVRMCWK